MPWDPESGEEPKDRNDLYRAIKSLEDEVRGLRETVDQIASSVDEASREAGGIVKAILSLDSLLVALIVLVAVGLARLFHLF